jgi:tetratricopeptide (TPR) repeat protein
MWISKTLLFVLIGSGPPFSLGAWGPQEDGERVSLQHFPLPDGLRTQIQQALDRKDFAAAEELLLKEIDSNPKSPRLLTLLGSIFFLDAKHLNAAVALKKAERLSPLDERSRFTLAMAYIVLDKRDWAEPELQKLKEAHPENPRYWYWLARLDYDAQRFHAGSAKLQKAIELNPRFARAYDNLGLCLEGLGQYDEAIRSYQKAVEINRELAAPSGWPALNLGILLAKLGRLDEAEGYLNESLRANPNLAQTHYQLGVVLEKKNRVERAVQELEKAAALDSSYSEPHYALGRIYRQLGQREKAQAAFAAFERLKAVKRTRGAPHVESQREEVSLEAASGPS